MSTNLCNSFIITTILILMTKQSITIDLMTQQQQQQQQQQYYYQQFNTYNNNNKLNSINNKVDENLLNQYNNLLKDEIKTNQANTHYKKNAVALKLPQQLLQQKYEKKTEYQKKDDIVIVTEANDYYHTINDTHDSDVIKYAINNNDNYNNNNKTNKIYMKNSHLMYKKKSILRENKRQRRELSNWLIAPHTRWCGSGNLANGTYSHLGGASKADKCCRKHDHCHSYIPGMSVRYELFNFRPYTLSHCKCDRRFRTCLKLAIDEDANAIGKLFFNMVQTKCFIVQSEKICQKRAADGSCEIEAVKKKAHLRNNRKY